MSRIRKSSEERSREYALEVALEEQRKRDVASLGLRMRKNAGTPESVLESATPGDEQQGTPLVLNLTPEKSHQKPRTAV